MRAEQLSAHELTGRACSHVQRLAGLPCLLHPQAGSALLRMRDAAARDGLDLWPVSGFRDFRHQLDIWNAKFRGDRTLLDRDSRPLQAGDLSAAERVAAILVWSALPGASRHHWGSDFDLIDRRALGSGEPPRLVSADYAPGGRHAPLAAWLAAHAHHFGFFHPYDRDRGGVQPEPWHLSYAPVAGPALAALSPALLAEALAGADLAGRETVLEQLASLFERHVRAVAQPPPALAADALSREARPA